MHTAPAERTARFGAGLARDEKVLVKTCLVEVMRARCPDARCTQSREADGTVVLARLARLTCCIARTGLDRFRAKLLVIGANRVVPDALAHDRVEQATGSLNECARPRWGRWGRVGCNRGRSNSGCDCTTDSDSMADVYHTDGARARESASSSIGTFTGTGTSRGPIPRSLDTAPPTLSRAVGRRLPGSQLLVHQPARRGARPPQTGVGAGADRAPRAARRLNIFLLQWNTVRSTLRYFAKITIVQGRCPRFQKTPLWSTRCRRGTRRYFAPRLKLSRRRSIVSTPRTKTKESI